MARNKLESFDLDTLIYDICEISDQIAKRCNILKRECVNDDKCSALDELENYFIKLQQFLKDNQATIRDNIVNVDGIQILESNCFYKLLK